MAMPADSRRHLCPMRSLSDRPRLRMPGLPSRIMARAPTSGGRAAASCPLGTAATQPLRPSVAPLWLALTSQAVLLWFFSRIRGSSAIRSSRHFMRPRTQMPSRACIPATSTRCSTWGTACQPRHHPPRPCRPPRCPLRDQLRRPLRPLLPIAMQCATAHRTARTIQAFAAAAPSAAETHLRLRLLLRLRPLRQHRATVPASASLLKTAQVTHSAAAAAPAAAEARLHLRLRLHPLRQHRAAVPAGASLPPTAQITHSVAAAAAEYGLSRPSGDETYVWEAQMSDCTNYPTSCSGCSFC